MSRSRSDGPATRVMRRRRRRALGYGDLPPEMKDAIQDYLRHTNESLRAAVKEYFRCRPSKAATERQFGEIGTWDVGRVTDMSRLFYDRAEFNEARAGVQSSRRASRSVDSTADPSPRRPSKHGFRRTSARGTHLR